MLPVARNFNMSLLCKKNQMKYKQFNLIFMKATINSIQFFLTLITFLFIGVISANSQALKVTPDADAGASLAITAHARFTYTGTSDGIDVVRPDYVTTALNLDNDLIWACFAQSQPNNAGIFGLTSLSAGLGWTSCFQVRANGNVGIFNSYPSAALEIGSSSSIRQVKVNGNIVLSSDERMKKNIKDIDISSSVGKLKQMRSVSYNFQEDDKEQPVPEKFKKNGIDTVKMKDEMKKVPKTNKDLLSRNFYGFLAQDVQKLFPDLVYADSAGMLSVDYIGIIPLLVNGMKDQQDQIDKLQLQIDELEKAVAKLSGASVSKSSPANAPSNSPTSLNGFSDNPATAVLHQNAPNPFTQDTNINFYIPETANAASLNIYDLQGKQLMQYTIVQRGEGSQIISGNHFSAGMYLYSLIVDGTVIDTKRMILTK